MQLTNRFFRSPIAVLLAVTVVSASVFAFAATNTVPDSNAGEGTSTISGYQTSGIEYTFDDSDPSEIVNVQFTLTPTNPDAPNPATNVKAKLLDSATYGAAVLASTNVSATTWIYTPTVATTVADTTALTIVAAQ